MLAVGKAVTVIKKKNREKLIGNLIIIIQHRTLNEYCQKNQATFQGILRQIMGSVFISNDPRIFQYPCWRVQKCYLWKLWISFQQRETILRNSERRKKASEYEWKLNVRSFSWKSSTLKKRITWSWEKLLEYSSGVCLKVDKRFEFLCYLQKMKFNILTGSCMPYHDKEWFLFD